MEQAQNEDDLNDYVPTKIVAKWFRTKNRQQVWWDIEENQILARCIRSGEHCYRDHNMQERSPQRIKVDDHQDLQ